MTVSAYSPLQNAGEHYGAPTDARSRKYTPGARVRDEVAGEGAPLHRQAERSSGGFEQDLTSESASTLQRYRAILGASAESLNDDEFAALLGQLRMLARVLVSTAPAARTRRRGSGARPRCQRKRSSTRG